VGVRGAAVYLPPVSSGDRELYHTPVLAGEVSRLAQGAHRAVDCTVGGGGHARVLLAAGAEVLAIDRDPEAIAHAKELLAGERVRFLTGSFASPEVIGAVREFCPDFVLLDLGVSSRQLEDDRRGFSFRPGVPLDMRMDPSDPSAPTAADLLNRLSEEKLEKLFRENADEPRAGHLAKIIARRRRQRPFAQSDDLVGAIREALGPRSGPKDFARIFQALRMGVNREREELESALPQLLEAMVPGGLIVAITYHSGEDRIVKRYFREWSRKCTCPPGQPVCRCTGVPRGSPLWRRPVRPAPEEVAANPRARSAKLRAFRKSDAG
jgi:16S rRNA (cytosine1402-N4)-methyltransferase